MSNNQDYYLNNETRSSLKKFQVSQNIFSKGKLSLVIQFTRMVKEKEFPLRVEDFQTDSRGQVSGISGSKLKRILKEHGITRQLTVEGGRTSRGSMGLMIAGDFTIHNTIVHCTTKPSELRKGSELAD